MVVSLVDTLSIELFIWKKNIVKVSLVKHAPVYVFYYSFNHFATLSFPTFVSITTSIGMEVGWKSIKGSKFKE